MKNPTNVSCETIAQTLKNFGLIASEQPLEHLSSKLVLFWNDFLSWNKIHNLSRITDPEEVVFLHFIDSLYPALFAEPFLKAHNVLDLGTGGGFPGIPLSLYFPDIKFHLLDKSRKKISFLRYVSSKLDLNNVFPTNIDFFNYNSPCDIIISRAVRIDNEILSHAEKLIVENGYLIVFITKDNPPLPDLIPYYTLDYSILGKDRSILFYRF